METVVVGDDDIVCTSDGGAGNKLGAAIGEIGGVPFGSDPISCEHSSIVCLLLLFALFTRNGPIALYIFIIVQNSFS